MCILKCKCIHLNFAFNQFFANNCRDKLMEHGVCVRVIGNLSLVPLDVLKLIMEAMRVTKNNNKAFLNVAFSYTCE